MNDARKYLRFCAGLKGLLRTTLTLEESRAVVLRRLARRETSFLEILEKVVIGNPRNPYNRLLDIAGYGLDDVAALVRREGLEDALARLAGDGVCLTFDEFKGRVPIERRGTTIICEERDFDNPLLAGQLHVESGATRSPGTRTMIDHDFVTAEAAHRAMALDVHGTTEAPCVLWFPILPGNAGIMNVLRQAKLGRPPARWFSQVDTRSIHPSPTDRWGTAFLLTAGRVFGRALPRPEPIDMGDAGQIVDTLVGILSQGTGCVVWTYVNSGVRIGAAARASGRRLDGATFFLAGEPVTGTKLEEVRATGARAIPYFAFAEGGIVAYGCGCPSAPDDMHVLTDQAAVIQHTRHLTIPTESSVKALLFTSLLPEAPKILLNVETGDEGDLVTRSCGCAYEKLGLTRHMSNVVSFEKCTSEGMTFPVRELIRITEEVLPVRFGGSSSDYQIAETEDSSGMMRLDVAVSPRVGPLTEDAVVAAIRDELGRGKDANRLMAEVWMRAGTLRVVRREPMPTKRGKILPFISKGVYRARLSAPHTSFRTH